MFIVCTHNMDMRMDTFVNVSPVPSILPWLSLSAVPSMPDVIGVATEHPKAQPYRGPSKSLRALVEVEGT